MMAFNPFIDCFLWLCIMQDSSANPSVQYGRQKMQWQKDVRPQDLKFVSYFILFLFLQLKYDSCSLVRRINGFLVET